MVVILQTSVPKTIEAAGPPAQIGAIGVTQSGLLAVPLVFSNCELRATSAMRTAGIRAQVQPAAGWGGGAATGLGELE